MFGKIKEECGVFGIYSMEKNEDVANITRIGISCLQHRGEESCGIAVNDGGLVCKNCYHEGYIFLGMVLITQHPEFF